MHEINLRVVRRKSQPEKKIRELGDEIFQEFGKERSNACGLIGSQVESGKDAGIFVLADEPGDLLRAVLRDEMFSRSAFAPICNSMVRRATASNRSARVGS
jgi:hypothetical protein